MLGTHDWNKFITPMELKSMIETHNLKVNNINGTIMKLDENIINNLLFPSQCHNMNNLISKGFRWELSPNDVEVNYICHAIKK